MKKTRVFLTVFLYLLAIPAAIAVGALLFKEKFYAWISLIIAILACLPLFYSFEYKENTSKEIAVLAVIIAISVAGRFVFAWLPGFKPVTAITVIAAIWLGKESGFTIGCLTALVSNFYFGQGPWTPFQMFAWGMLGFLAGLLSKPLKKSRILLLIYGVFAGIAYSFTMDVWTTLWTDGTFNLSRYIAFVTAALPITAEYAISNLIFLLILTKPIGEKLKRIKTKYGLFVS